MNFSFSDNQLQRVFLSIQSMYLVTLVYTPGYPGSPHLFPNETIPICIHLPSCFSINGPPESPCKENDSYLMAKRLVVKN